MAPVVVTKVGVGIVSNVTVRKEKDLDYDFWLYDSNEKLGDIFQKEVEQPSQGEQVLKD